jgi:hypothetical protein
MKLKTIYGNVIIALETAKTVAELVGAALEAKKSLCGADLSVANLCGADLSVANLCGASLSGANLCGASLSGANLYGANLSWANLCGASLSGANLCGANLCGASLYGASLSGANLYGANLSGATNADLAIARMQFIPEEGQFIGWKKCVGSVIVKLRIPADAKRSHGSERKCRCSKAVVLAIYGPDGVERKSAKSLHNSKFIYATGKTAKADGFDDDRWNTCGQGIHFYLTRTEAEVHV